MARRFSQRERTQEAHPDDAPLTKRQQLEEDPCSHVAEVLEKDHGRDDDVQVNTKTQIVVLLLYLWKHCLSLGNFYCLFHFGFDV